MTRVVQRPPMRSRRTAVAFLVAYAAISMLLAALIVDAVTNPDPAVVAATSTTTTATSSPVAPATTADDADTTTSSSHPPATEEVDARPIESAHPGTTGGIPSPGTWTWDELADCESGEWVRHADGTVTFVEGSANWATHDGVHEGGLQFAVSTWDAFKPTGFPDGAHQATREQQITVGEAVLEQQGPDAWPTCGPMIGMR